MAFQFAKSEKVRPGLRRIARERLGRAIEIVEHARREGATRDDVDLAVHEARKRCKEVRALIRLVRPSLGVYNETNAMLRDAARLLAELRDATTVVEAFDGLISEQEANRFAPVRASLVRERAERAGDEGARLGEFVERVREVRDRAVAWKLDEKGFDAVGPGLEKTYARCKSAMALASTEPTTDNLHDWRKVVKDNRHHLRLLRGLWRPVIEPVREEAKRLGDLLGEEHDLAVLSETLGDGSVGETGLVEELVARTSDERVRRREAAFALGARLYAQEPCDYARHARVLWDASRGARRAKK